MTLDQFTNVLLPTAAFAVVAYSAAQLVSRHDRFWPFRLGQLLVTLGVLALSLNLMFGSSCRFLAASTRATEACCLAGGISIVAAMLVRRDPTRDRPV